MGTHVLLLSSLQTSASVHLIGSGVAPAPVCVGRMKSKSVVATSFVEWTWVQHVNNLTYIIFLVRNKQKVHIQMQLFPTEYGAEESSP